MKLHCYWSVVSAFFGALIHCDAWIAPLSDDVPLYSHYGILGPALRQCPPARAERLRRAAHAAHRTPRHARSAGTPAIVRLRAVGQLSRQAKQRGAGGALDRPRSSPRCSARTSSARCHHPARTVRPATFPSTACPIVALCMWQARALGP